VRAHIRRLGAPRQEQFSGFDNPIEIENAAEKQLAFHRWVLGHLEATGKFTSTDTRFKAGLRNLADAGLVTLGEESKPFWPEGADWNTKSRTYQTAFLTPGGAQVIADHPRDPRELHADWAGGEA
jgi:hypothetical protein